MSADGKFTLDVITQPDQLKSLRDDWRRLDEVTTHPSIFLTWEWMEAWLHSVRWQRRLYCVVVREPGGQVAAIAPLMLGVRGQLDRGTRILSFIGSDGPAGGTYLDLIARPEWEGRAHQAVMRHLAEHRRLFSYFSLNRVAVDAPAFVHWTSAALDCGLHATVDLRRRTVWFPLPRTYASFVESLSNVRWRRRVRNFPAAFKKTFPSAQYVDRGTERPLDSVLADLRRLQETRFGEEKNYFHRPRFSEYIHRACSNMQEAGRLRALCLLLDGRTVAQRIGLVHRGTWVDFHTGSDPAFLEHNVGHLLLWHCIERAIGEGLERMDLLDEQEYKLRYFRNTRLVADLRFFDDRPVSASRLILRATGRVTRHLARTLVPDRLRSLLRAK